MFKNIIRDTAVPASTTLVGKEKLAIGMDGVLTDTIGDFVWGIVKSGEAAGYGSEIITGGECDAIVDGLNNNIAAEDPLTGGSSGMLFKGTIGTHKIRAYAKEAATTSGATITVFMV